MFGDPATNPKVTIAEMLTRSDLLLHKDGNHGSMYPRAEDFGAEGIPFLTAKNVNDDGFLDHASVERLSEAKANRLRIGWILPGDILLAHNASAGKVAHYDGRYPKALIGTSLTAFRPNPLKLESGFLETMMRLQFFQRQLEKNMGQTTRNQVPITAQRELQLFLPPLPLQQEFARRVEKVEQLRSAHRAAAAKLDELFAGLQYRAFAGEL